MADNDQTNGQANGGAGAGKRVPTDYGKVCESEDDLKAVAKPEKGEAYMVTLFAGDTPRWCYADGYIQAYARVAKARGGSCTRTGKPPAPVTKEAVAAKLATFSDDELAALGLRRKPVAKGKRGN